MKLTQSRPEIEVYLFDDVYPLVGDMSYYKHAGHYTAAVNIWMHERIGAKGHAVFANPWGL